MMMNNDEGGRVGRKKKTPAELAAEANADSDDEEFASKFSSVCCCLNFFQCQDTHQNPGYPPCKQSARGAPEGHVLCNGFLYVSMFVEYVNIRYQLLCTCNFFLQLCSCIFDNQFQRIPFCHCSWCHLWALKTCQNLTPV